METTIKRKLSTNQMIKLFDNPEKINIRFYETTKPVKSITDFDEKRFFNIKIRHCEDENPKDIFTNSLKELC